MGLMYAQNRRRARQRPSCLSAHSLASIASGTNISTKPTKRHGRRALADQSSTGNIALKTAEGVARFISALLKEALTSSLQAKVGAAIAMPALKAMGRRIDPSSINGGPLLGLNGIVVKSHGGADAKGFANAIRIAVDLARSDYLTKVRDSLNRLPAALELPAATPETVTEPSQ